MKRRLTICITALALLVVPLTLLVWGFLLPCQYEDTFLGELRYKCRRLDETPGRRIVFVGGSSVAFGIDSGLVERELPGCTAVNFGLYAGLGTQTMLELSRDSLRAGDIVILLPEQQEQALSGWFGAEYLWQGVDGAFGLLTRLDSDHWGALAGTFPRFAADKLNCWLACTPPQTEGVYARSAFDERGDIVSPLCAQNTMPGGWDTNMPIRFQPDMISEDFAAFVGQYARDLGKRGVTVWYHFCPMNSLAAQQWDAGYFDALQQRLNIPVIGNPEACLMDPAWFYDTNFHLNGSGKTAFTRLLIRDIKAMLGDSTPTDIALPEPPALAVPAEAGNNTDADCFTYTIRDGEAILTGLTEQGRGRNRLTIPGSFEGCGVRRLPVGVLSGPLVSVTVPANIAIIEDGAFADCPRLASVVMQSAAPEACSVGQELLRGTDADILVPREAVSRYKLNYFWSPYAARIRGYDKEEQSWP